MRPALKKDVKHPLARSMIITELHAGDAFLLHFRVKLRFRFRLRLRPHGLVQQAASRSDRNDAARNE
jgi:hypothetical protein